MGILSAGSVRECRSRRARAYLAGGPSLAEGCGAAATGSLARVGSIWACSPLLVPGVPLPITSSRVGHLWDARWSRIAWVGGPAKGIRLRFAVAAGCARRAGPWVEGQVVPGG